MKDLTQLDVFYGDLTANLAYVYSRLPRPADDAGLSRTGFVRGPRCLHAETLPLTAKLVDLGPGPTLLARALVPEPCFWSPDLPAIYDITVNLVRGTEIIATERREIGLRAVGVRDGHLFLDGKRWVLRGVSSKSTKATMPRVWHESSAAFVATDADSESLAEASQWGALTVAFVLDAPERPLISRLRELANYPAAAIAAIQRPLPNDLNKAQVAPNVLLAQWISPENGHRPEPWADLLLVCADEMDIFTEIAANAQAPIIAARFLDDHLQDLESARAACDVLQRDLAPIGQFAGYIV